MKQVAKDRGIGKRDVYAYYKKVGLKMFKTIGIFAHVDGGKTTLVNSFYIKMEV